MFTNWFRMDANLTLSQNKVLDYTFADFADGDADPKLVTRTTDLALSPNIVGAAIATFVPIKNGKLQLIGKYVGKQYADNTSRECYAIDPYFLLNVKASYTWKLKGTNEIEAQLLVNNLLDHHYRLSAWVGDWVDDWSGPAAAYYYHDRAWLQQPGINFMARVIYRF
jgi:iron complex outermembrane receptor protein